MDDLFKGGFTLGDTNKPKPQQQPQMQQMHNSMMGQM